MGRQVAGTRRDVRVIVERVKVGTGAGEVQGLNWFVLMVKSENVCEQV